MLCQKMELNKAARKRRKSIKSPSGFKKAPQAPRRFKSPYILFSISKIQEYKRIVFKFNLEGVESPIGGGEEQVEVSCRAR